MIESEEKEKFKVIFEELVATFIQRYPFKEGEEYDIIGFVINNFLNELKLDIMKMDFLQFYDSYLKGTLFIDANSFTTSQIKRIIEESPLSDRDKKLALFYWVEPKTEDEISCELGIDRKTARNNVSKISMVLKKTASKIYKEFI